MAAPRCFVLSGTLTPFLYPPQVLRTVVRIPMRVRGCLPSQQQGACRRRHVAGTAAGESSTPIFAAEMGDQRQPTTAGVPVAEDTETISSSQSQPTSPSEDPSPYDEEPFISSADYRDTPFTDSLTLTLTSGPGGHGCTSFLREKFIAAGPPNGGDGGRGGSISIRAVPGLTSLHKLARFAGTVKAGRGKSGRGSGRGGERGADVVVEVPVGTVVREVGRFDPAAEREGGEEEDAQAERARFILWPGLSSTDRNRIDLPSLQGRRRNTIPQPPAPITLDLSAPTSHPVLLAAGGAGGLGNTHFVTRERPRPNFATRGEDGMQLTVSLELKILADVGLVGFPNAGKSSFVRSVSRSRARVGGWAFTTLRPGIGTVVLDTLEGRAKVPGRERFTIADIPGLVVGASSGRGMGGEFLRHVERAAVLGFVVDLSGRQGEPVETVRQLWRELRAYEEQRMEGGGTVEWKPMVTADEARRVVVGGAAAVAGEARTSLAPPVRISEKPWFIVGTKADLPGSRENFLTLQAWLKEKNARAEAEEPGKGKGGWKGEVAAFPVCAIRGEGVGKIIEWVAGLLDREGVDGGKVQ